MKLPANKWLAGTFAGAMITTLATLFGASSSIAADEKNTPGQSEVSPSPYNDKLIPEIHKDDELKGSAINSANKTPPTFSRDEEYGEYMDMWIKKIQEAVEGKDSTEETPEIPEAPETPEPK